MTMVKRPLISDHIVAAANTVELEGGLIYLRPTAVSDGNKNPKVHQR